MNQPLLVTIPLCAADLPLAESMLRHLVFMGQIPMHAVQFIADYSLTKEQLDPIIALAQPVFPAGGGLLKTANLLPAGTSAFPHAYNFRFETVARYIAANQKCPWLWLDPRCVANKKGWLIELEHEYYAGRKEILGQLMTPQTHGTAQPIVSGVAVYPPTLPKRMMQRLIAQRGVEFEKSCAELTLPITHPSKLIWVHALNGTDALPNPPANVALVHTKQAKLYAAKVRGEPTPTPAQTPTIPPPAIPKSLSIPKGLEKLDLLAKPPETIAKAAYYHSGDLGDIIYALAAIRLAGGGRLLLGPRVKRTPPPANPMKLDQFERFRPLLEAQPYLTKVQFTDRYPGTDVAFDLNIFRSQWGDKTLRERTGINTLARMHCHTLGVDEKFRPDEPWLVVPEPITTPHFTIHRSPRYHPTGGTAGFPWPMVLKRYAGKLLFVGHAQEHADFERAFGVRVAFWKCADFLEMARIIAGSLGFIGNQSFPNAIALACGQRVCQEAWDVSPDCVLVRPNFLRQPFSEPALEKWEKSDKITPKLIPKVEIVSQPRRAVSTKPINGFIELGPQENAYGLGDTLCVTPLAEKLGAKAVMCLPPSMSDYAPLFDGLCKTRITEDFPVFRDPGKERFIESKLRMFGFACEDGKTLPVIRLTNEERAAVDLQTNGKPPLIFHTSCAKRWREVRSRPPEFWKPLSEKLSESFALTDQTGGSVRTLAALYSNVGLYFGVNTGNWHVAMAVGCKCLVVDADQCEGYDPTLWLYNLPSVEYSGFNQENIIAKIPWLLGKP